MQALHRSRTYPRWFMPAFSLFLGLLLFGAAWIGGDPGTGVGMFALMAAVAAVFALGGRSETIRLIRQPDERWSRLDLVATSITGLVIIGVLIAAFLWELAH